MRVTFAYPQTTADGTVRAPDETADLPDDEARQLLKDGVVRRADYEDGDARTPGAAPSTDTSGTPEPVIPAQPPKQGARSRTGGEN